MFCYVNVWFVMRIILSSLCQAIHHGFGRYFLSLECFSASLPVTVPLHRFMLIITIWNMINLSLSLSFYSREGANHQRTFLQPPFGIIRRQVRPRKRQKKALWSLTSLIRSWPVQGDWDRRDSMESEVHRNIRMLPICKRSRTKTNK